jgi:excisionase family DNA binding protein
MNHQSAADVRRIVAEQLAHNLEAVRQIVREELGHVPPKATLLTYAEAARKLRVSRATLKRMVQRRAIAVTRPSPGCPRIREAEVERVLNKLTREAK